MDRNDKGVFVPGHQTSDAIRNKISNTLNQSGDLTNRIFGQWTVLWRGPSKSGQRLWWSRCSCGIEKFVAQRNLINGNSTCCIKCSGKKNQSRAHNRNVSKNGRVQFSPGIAKWIQDVRRNLHKKQNGICPICLQPVKTNDCLDHDHETDLVRALVHRGCNVFIGFIENHEGVIDRTLKHIEDGRA
jgi:hypothetical protein